MLSAGPVIYRAPTALTVLVSAGLEVPLVHPFLVLIHQSLRLFWLCRRSFNTVRFQCCSFTLTNTKIHKLTAVVHLKEHSFLWNIILAFNVLIVRTPPPPLVCPMWSRFVFSQSYCLNCRICLISVSFFLFFQVLFLYFPPAVFYFRSHVKPDKSPIRVMDSTF